MNDYISDNLMASFIDGTLSPLEKLACGDYLNDMRDDEILEIIKDTKSMRSHIEKIKPIRFSECERYIGEIRRHELPNNLNETKSNVF